VRSIASVVLRHACFAGVGLLELSFCCAFIGARERSRTLLYLVEILVPERWLVCLLPLSCLLRVQFMFFNVVSLVIQAVTILIGGGALLVYGSLCTWKYLSRPSAFNSCEWHTNHPACVAPPPIDRMHRVPEGDCIVRVNAYVWLVFALLLQCVLVAMHVRLHHHTPTIVHHEACRFVSFLELRVPCRLVQAAAIIFSKQIGEEATWDALVHYGPHYSAMGSNAYHYPQG
jgi:hypothetical protein